MAEVETAIERLGMVQIDSVTAVDRAHRLTLAARLGRLPDDGINELRRQGRVFEYWAHEACLLPCRSGAISRTCAVGASIHGGAAC